MGEPPVASALNSTVAGAVLLVLLMSIFVANRSNSVLIGSVLFADVIVTSTFAVAFWKVYPNLSLIVLYCNLQLW